jgi:hypothetical protein
MKKQLAFVIVYNHQYNKNIEILETIYSHRFTHIYHLVPFYSGDKSNVIPVYENSYYFQGYIAQGLKSYFDENYVHYMFIADDLLLHPDINEANYKEFFKLGDNTCFVPDFEEFHTKKKWWPRMHEAYNYLIKQPGVEVEKMLPDKETAIAKFKEYGLEYKPVQFGKLWNFKQLWRRVRYLPESDLRDEPGAIIVLYLKYLLRLLCTLLTNKKYYLPYPMVGSYSDLLIVSADVIKPFCQYCGVFAATRLFVEIALPTAVVLSTSDIVTEKELDFHAVLLWNEKDFKRLDRYNFQLKNLLQDFPEKTLYIHPIKLSKWNTTL